MHGISEEIASLKRENARLRKLLKLTDAEATPSAGSQSAWFDKPPGTVDASSLPRAKVDFYAALFAARRDVYAVAWTSARTGKSGWQPAVEGGWRRGRSAPPSYLPLTQDVIAAHLQGEIRIGLYPMVAGDRTHWLAADFDGEAAVLDALAYIKAARAAGAPAALEISRSGVGAHVWIFFTEPIAAGVARQLGMAFIREAIAIRGRMGLQCYDRLFPSQDTLPGNGPGNQIAAPLQGESRKLGATVFLDLATLEPFEDQWYCLSTLDRVSARQAKQLAADLAEPAVGPRVKRLRRANATKTQPNPAPVVHVQLDGGVRIPGAELSPSVYATLTHAASTYNPEFYDRQRRRQSTWNVPRIITSDDVTTDDYLVLPRGLRETVTDVLKRAGSTVEIEERRAGGEPQRFALDAQLDDGQEAAVNDLVSHELGLLVAPPGSGKTVMACAVIAKRATSTLVLVDRKTLADQWRRQIQELLAV
jgi:hypothetical protein